MPFTDAHAVEHVSVDCSLCDTTNRVAVAKAIQDLRAVRCGRCREPLLRTAGEPLAQLDPDALSHPFDREALKKLRALPYADKILSGIMVNTLDKVTRFQFLAASVKVSDRQAPHLWALYREAAVRLDIEPPPLFITQDPRLNAFAIGAGVPLIVVTSGLLDGLDDGQLVGVLGHELTHVKLGHGLYRTLAILLATGGVHVLDRLLGIGSLLVMPFQIALMQWYQMSELSADRGELLTTANLDTFVRTHLILAGGNNRFLAQPDVAAFIAQADEAEEVRDTDLLVSMMELFDRSQRTHPLTAWRVHHGLRWIRSEAFFHLLARRRRRAA